MTVELRRPEACSLLSLSVDEPLAATAPNPQAWLALEQPGPWGRKAPSASHLDRVLGAELDARAKAAGVTLVLIRRPGRHADTHDVTRRTVLAAHPAAGWLEQGVVDDPAALLDVDLEAMAAGIPPRLGTAPESPLVLVCTNGRRDLCCAEVGRARVTALAPVLGDSLWESSHLGGHRFAPTVLLLPSGVVLGRASAQDVLDALAGRLPLHAFRGHSALAPAAQAAEGQVLAEIGAHEAGRLRIEPVDRHRPVVGDRPARRRPQLVGHLGAPYRSRAPRVLRPRGRTCGQPGRHRRAAHGRMTPVEPSAQLASDADFADVVAANAAYAQSFRLKGLPAVAGLEPRRRHVHGLPHRAAQHARARARRREDPAQRRRAGHRRRPAHAGARRAPAGRTARHGGPAHPLQDGAGHRGRGPRHPGREGPGLAFAGVPHGQRPRGHVARRRPAHRLVAVPARRRGRRAASSTTSTPDCSTGSADPTVRRTSLRPTRWHASRAGRPRPSSCRCPGAHPGPPGRSPRTR